MIVFITCKNGEDLIKNEGAGVLTKLYINFSDAQGQITSESKLKLVQAFMHVLVTLSCMSWLPARIKMIQLKMKELE